MFSKFSVTSMYFTIKGLIKKRGEKRHKAIARLTEMHFGTRVSFHQSATKVVSCFSS